MTQDDTYRARAQTVRLAARAQLLDLRRARLAKRPGAEGVGQHADTVSGSVACDAPPEVTVESDESLVDWHADPADVPAIDQGLAPVVTDPVPEVVTPIEGEGVAPPPKPKRKPPVSKAKTKDTVKTPDKPAKATAMFVPKPRTIPVVLARPPAEPAVADAEDQSILAAAMSEIEDDTPSPVPHSAKAAFDVRPEAVAMAAALPDQDASEPEADLATGDVEPDPVCDNTVCDLGEPQDAPCAPLMSEPEAIAVAAPEAEPDPKPQPSAGLYALPGAGPGLVWMLGQVGIDSMDDLARADADELGRKLGLIGQILNVGSWVTFARSAAVIGTPGDGYASAGPN